jgi:hypothetical protein
MTSPPRRLRYIPPGKGWSKYRVIQVLDSDKNELTRSVVNINSDDMKPGLLSSYRPLGGVGNERLNYLNLSFPIEITRNYRLPPN